MWDIPIILCVHYQQRHLQSLGEEIIYQSLALARGQKISYLKEETYHNFGERIEPMDEEALYELCRIR